MQISAASLYSGSRLNTSARIVAPGSVALTAVRITALFKVSFTSTLTATTRVHTVPRLSVPPVSCGIRPDRLWKVTDAAP